MFTVIMLLRSLSSLFCLSCCTVDSADCELDLKQGAQQARQMSLRKVSDESFGLDETLDLDWT